MSKGGKVLFVGTKKQAQQAVKETAKECGQFFVTERWLGGTLTNFATIKRSIARLKEIEKMEADGSINNYVKQEQSVIRREAGAAGEVFRGHSRHGQAAGARCSWWTSSASTTPWPRRAGSRFPSWPSWTRTAIPDLVDYPIAGNDDAIRSVRMILATIGQIVTQAQAEYETKYARRKRPKKPPPPAPEATPEAAPVAAPARGPRRLRRGLDFYLGTRFDPQRLRPRSALPSTINDQLSTQDSLVWLKLLLPSLANCAR